MYRYLALVFFVLGVNCAEDDSPKAAFYDFLNTEGSLSPPEPDIEKIMNSLSAIPESSYQKADEFLKNIQSDLKSYPAENSVRQHVEHAATVMAFFEQARFEPSTEQTTIIKDNMKQLVPKFSASLAKIGQLFDPTALTSSSERTEINQLKLKHIDWVIKSIKELDPSILQKLKSYSNDTVKELKESGINLDNVVLRHLYKVKIMIDIFEATGGEKPTGEFLKANRWVAQAFETVSRVFLREMVYLAEFANIIRMIESDDA